MPPPDRVTCEVRAEKGVAKEKGSSTAEDDSPRDMCDRPLQPSSIRVAAPFSQEGHEQRQHEDVASLYTFS